ncbi:MAG: hypothetical protein M1835_006105 [Candelina submexicana]|nr:MAG: hypothetical protein M1835_006105 [Candelina submexicana]
MADFGVETWLMHGSLLGWWWNQKAADLGAKILPWDSDVDVQVTEASMHILASYYNMTMHHYETLRFPQGRTYMLEINPHYVKRGIEDRLNVIDGRWIDTETGMFIDITTVRRNETAEAEGIEGALMCKDEHHYLEKEIFPLRQSLFEDSHVLVPYAYVRILQEEYGNKALTNTKFQRLVSFYPIILVLPS